MNQYDIYKNMVLGGFIDKATSNAGSTNAINTNEMNRFSALGNKNRFRQLMTSPAAYGSLPTAPVNVPKFVDRQALSRNANRTMPKGNVNQDATPPNFKNNLLNYVLSPEGQGFAQGLLEASGYSTMPTSMGTALALASKRSDEAVDREAKKEQQEFLNLMKEKEFSLAEGKDEREQQIFDRSILRDDKSKEIFDSINKDDYANDREYYSAVAQELLKEGYIAEGTKLAELGKPTTIKDFTKEIIGANKEEKKTFDVVKKGVDNFKQILDAAEQQGGASSYALMIKFIKQLDDSVVREGEVRTFGTFQGLYNQLKIEIDKFQGEGFPPEIKSQIVKSQI